MKHPDKYYVFILEKLKYYSNTISSTNKTWDVNFPNENILPTAEYEGTS